VPEIDTANLRSLEDALREMEARPLGPFGNWTVVESGVEFQAHGGARIGGMDA
jgi:hypothetical protein